MPQNNDVKNSNENGNSGARSTKKADETGPIGIPGVNATSTDEAWKVVGSPSRRGSLAAPTSSNSNSNSNNPTDKPSPAASPTPNSVDIPGGRRPSLDPSQWGSFGGFQWEGPGIFDTEARKSSYSTTPMVPPGAPAPEVIVDDIPYAPHHRLSFTYDNSILSVPMLPGVSIEPIMRQQRSLSFSVGQDPTFFGYDDYDDPPGTHSQKQQQQQQQQQQQHQQHLYNATNATSMSYGYRNSLATMEEEQDDDEDDMLRDLIDQESNAARWRARSQSSGAAFGLLSPSQHAALLSRQLRRGSEQHDDLIQQRRRSSRFFGDGPSSTTSGATTSGPSAYPQMSMGDRERLELIQRRLSQSHGNDYTFPDQSNSYNLLQQRRHSLNQPHHPHQVQQLSEHLENTSIRGPGSDAYGQHPSIATGSYPTQQQQQQLHPHPMSQQSHSQPIQLNRHHEEYFDAEHQQQLQKQHQQQQQRQRQQQAHQPSTSMTSNGPFRDAGKGIALQRLPDYTALYSIEFKAGRVDYFYVPSEQGMAPVKFQAGDLVIVEGDRGKDLGKVTSDALTVDKVEQLVSQKLQQQQALPEDDGSNDKPKDVHIKRLYRLATPDEINLLLEKGQDEVRALALCQQKTKMRNLPMTVVDAEYQWDRRKLTFFFVSDRRNDFRELVRELFKIYKTRIWMCAVNPDTAASVTDPSSSPNVNSGF